MAFLRNIRQFTDAELTTNKFTAECLIIKSRKNVP